MDAVLFEVAEGLLRRRPKACTMFANIIIIKIIIVNNY